jgi:hypothetical protein
MGKQIRRPGFPAAFVRLPLPVFVYSQEMFNGFASSENPDPNSKEKASRDARLFPGLLVSQKARPDDWF